MCAVLCVSLCHRFYLFTEYIVNRFKVNAQTHFVFRFARCGRVLLFDLVLFFSALCFHVLVELGLFAEKEMCFFCQLAHSDQLQQSTQSAGRFQLLFFFFRFHYEFMDMFAASVVNEYFLLLPNRF